MVNGGEPVISLTKSLFKHDAVNSAEYPRIEPVSEGVLRPFWSVMIPTYNRAEYLEQTLTGVLAQDPGPEEMQIEVVDNCSTEGDPRAVVSKVGGDRVCFYRQHKNVGVAANWNTCIRRARGFWVHILHDDDVVLPGFYASYRHFIEQYPQVAMLFSKAISICENGDRGRELWAPPAQGSSGLVARAAEKLVQGNFVVSSTAVVRRSAYERAGAFHTSLLADWLMWVRVAASGEMGYIHEPYLLRRSHAGTETHRLLSQGTYTRQIVKTIGVILQELPRDRRASLKRGAYRNYSRWALGWRAMCHSKQLHREAFSLALWAFKLKPSSCHLHHIAESFALWTGQAIGRRQF